MSKKTARPPKQTDIPQAPKRKRPDLTVRWSEDERREIDEAAKARGIKPSQIIRIAVRAWYDNEKRLKERNS